MISKQKFFLPGLSKTGNFWLFRMLFPVSLALLVLLCSAESTATESTAAESTAAAPAPTMDAYVTCAVYHRMMAGSFRRVRQMPEMANLETEKMDIFVKLAKAAGSEEFGEAEVEAAFLDSWKYDLNRMENKINRNYENVSRLTYIYKNRCSKYLR